MVQYLSNGRLKSTEIDKNKLDKFCRSVAKAMKKRAKKARKTLDGKMQPFKSCRLNPRQLRKLNMFWKKKLLPVVDKEYASRKCTRQYVGDFATKEDLKQLAIKKNYTCSVLCYRMDLSDSDSYNHLSYDHVVPLDKAKFIKGSFSVNQ